MHSYKNVFDITYEHSFRGWNSWHMIFDKVNIGINLIFSLNCGYYATHFILYATYFKFLIAFIISI